MASAAPSKFRQARVAGLETSAGDTPYEQHEGRLQIALTAVLLIIASALLCTILLEEDTQQLFKADVVKAISTGSGQRDVAAFQWASTHDSSGSKIGASEEASGQAGRNTDRRSLRIGKAETLLWGSVLQDGIEFALPGSKEEAKH